MRRDATGKFTSNWDYEAKRRVSVTLTKTAWRLLEEEAQKYNISRSELIERTARSFAIANQPVKTKGNEEGHGFVVGSNSSGDRPNDSISFDSSSDNARTHLTATTPAEQKVSAILESISDAFVAFDRNWHYTYVNQAAARIIGKTSAELLGKHVWNEVFPEFVGSIAYQQLHRAIAQQVPVFWEEYEQAIPRWLEVNAYPSDEGVTLYFRDITERKQAEQTLRNTAERLSLALAAAQLGDWSWDAATDVVTFSERAAEIFGIPPGPYMTWTQIRDLLHEDDRELARLEVEKAIANRSDYSIEYRVLHKDGSQCWIAASGRAYYSPTGEVIGMLGVVQDITQRKQLQAQLQNQKQQFKMLADNAPDIIARFDAKFCHLYVSPSIEEVTGIPATAFIGKTNTELGMPEEVCIAWRNSLEKVFATGLEQQIEFQYPTPNGIRWYQSRLVPEFAGSGVIESVLGITRDFQEYKQAEQALRRSEERLRFALEAAGMVAWEWNRTTGEVVRSHTSHEIIGISCDAGSEVDSEFFNLIHADDRGLVFGSLDRAIAEKSSYSAEFRIIKPDGSLRWMFDRGRVICNDGGNVVRMSGVIQDITDRKQVEFALRESELKFRTLADKMPQLFWITRPDGYHEYFNQRWFEYTGMTLEQTQGWSWHNLLHPDDRQRSLEIWQQSLRTGNDYTIEYRFQRASDREYRWFLGLAFPMRDADGQIIKWFGSCTDIHDQRCLLEERNRALAQEQSARQQAEAANRIKDEFLAVLSHELRTPLNPILGWSRLLRQGKLDANKTTVALETIERNAKLQIQLIDDLLDISRILQGKLSLNSAAVNLQRTITAAIETVRLAAEAKAIQIQTQFTSETVTVLGDATRLQQVFWNLIANAVKFTPQNGQIKVRLSKSKSQAQIQVQDTGKGIRPEFLPFVFDTFRQADSSTTRTFGGLGLGLAIVRHLVELHGGLVKAESTGEEQGATFTVTLPLMLAAVSTSQAAAMSDRFHLQGINILAVDDEVDNLELVQFILEQAGATVVVVSLATEALVKLRQSKPDILLTDIAMPQVDGYTLMQQIRQLPAEQGGQIPAIALTAYAGEMNQQQALAASFQMHLSKPIDPEVLVQAIFELLN
ncbi:MAG: PAS domain S-box protein [Nostoc sp. ChiSLP02]|nr:PAS domain S-box protein [Nostoc sp. DedSLP05]MDZ8098089.1 PAS domain S-box protein [Nostoc sp. DedSLP01]MDZ8187394.1 PAS domain S-box protein [Nostoc sp. ChiSLP02]